MGNPYFDGRSLPQYASSLLLYADVLGTRERSASRDSLLDAYDSISTHLLLSGQDVGWAEGAISSFSDTVIYSELLTDAAPQQLIAVIKRAAQFQLANILTAKGPIRGAITIGDFFHDSRLAYGPALVAAVELEEKRARHPRIILSDEVANLILRLESDCDGFICLDEADSTYFVGYLSVTQLIPIMGASGSPAQALRIHKLIIEEKLRQGDAIEKYSWLATYHNCYISRACPERNDLEIGLQSPISRDTPISLRPIEETA